MSTPSRPPSSPSPVELEPVTCWPLIFGAVGFVCLGLLTVTGIATWSALFPPPKPAAVVETPPPEPEMVASRTEPIDLPAPAAAGNDNERQVKVRREAVREYHRLPAVSKSEEESQRLDTARKWKPPSRKARLAKHPMLAETVPTSSLKPLDRSERELLEWLWKRSSEIDLYAQASAAEKMLAEGQKLARERLVAEKKEALPLTKAIRALLDVRSDLRGLPLQDEKDCQLTPEATILLAAISPRVRRLQLSPAAIETLEREAADTSYGRYMPKVNEELLKFVRQTTRSHAKRPAVVRPLEQMIQTERAELRRGLVESLAEVEGKEATEAIARRAVFDLSPEVREAAVKALSKRSLEESRPVFLAALRHPWSPAADHAAQALVGLNDQTAFESVRKLVDEPDPCLPFQEDKKWYVREVVRVNHLRNCLLCHAVSLDNADKVRAPIPTPGQRLPVVYYSSRSPLPSVRADIVYLRQDFSAMHEVEKPEKWPKHQRFDYLVRKRELTAKEIEKVPADAGKNRVASLKSYPQRDAVLYTLYGLAFARRTNVEASR
jgi:hypothetical protein